MGEIEDPGLLLFGRYLALKLPGHFRKFGDHRLELRDPAARFIDLKAPKARKRIPRIHLHLQEAGERQAKAGSPSQTQIRDNFCRNAEAPQRRTWPAWSRRSRFYQLCLSKVAQSLPVRSRMQTFRRACLGV